jgi:hypothetical protein
MMRVGRYLSPTVLLLSMCAPAFAESSEDCGQKWTANEAAGTAVYQGFMMSAHSIVVDMSGWGAMTYAEKQGLVDLFSCAFPMSSGTRYRIDFLSNMTNNPVGQWTEEGGLMVIER